MPWSSSDRRDRLPRDWHRRRAIAKRNAQGRCQAEVHEPECDGIGTQCDHIINNDNHDETNLQWLSEPCHRAKTARETAAGRRAFYGRAKHPTERHPGLI